MKRIVCLILLLLFMLSMCSCTRTMVEKKEDELKANRWQGKGDYMTVVDLSFSGDNATLKIESGGGAKTNISGLCIVDEEKIILTDKELNENFKFNYNLNRDKVELEYNGKKLVLSKVKK